MPQVLSICSSLCSRGKLRVLGILQLAQQCGQAALPSLGSLWHTDFQSGATCYQPQLLKDFIKNKTHRHFANTRFLVHSQNPYYFVRALASWKGIDISLGVRCTFHLRIETSDKILNLIQSGFQWVAAPRVFAAELGSRVTWKQTDPLSNTNTTRVLLSIA